MYKATSQLVVFDEQTKLILTPLDADGYGALTSYALEQCPKYSAQEELLRYIDKVDKEDRRALIQRAMELDHDEEMRERFIQVKVPAKAFFLPKVAAFFLYLMAIPRQPAIKLDECEAIVNRIGPPNVVGRISVAFPNDDEKKDSGLSASPSGGPLSTGPSESSASEEPPQTTSA